MLWRELFEFAVSGLLLLLLLGENRGISGAVDLGDFGSLRDRVRTGRGVFGGKM